MKLEIYENMRNFFLYNEAYRIHEFIQGLSCMQYKPCSFLTHEYDCYP